MPTLTFTNVTKRFHSRQGGTAAVSNFSLDVNDGELLVLVGPSGCGKSTTLRLAAGLEKPDTGDIMFDGSSLSGISAKDRNIAMVFQNYALYPHMTAFENMAFGLKMRGVSRVEREDAVRRVASMLELDHLLHRRPEAMSGGECQRVAIGRAVVRSPRLFLFDEPLSNLDARLRDRIRTAIKRLQKTLKTSTLYVTHDQSEAMALGDRIAVMNEGALEQVGTPMEIYKRPANAFVASFIGSPPMNLYDGSVVQVDGQTCIDTPLGLVRPDIETLHARSLSLGSHLVIGFRPDAVELDDRRRDDDRTAWSGLARVELVEPTGDRQQLHLIVNDDVALTAVCSTDIASAPDDRLPVRISPDKIQLFPASARTPQSL
ncbi:MAG: ABC transporter ATP-binding protein [Phycisphaerae bacterium]